MGRLATNIAAAGVDADNLPNRLPEISLWDAFLPRRRSSTKKRVTSEVGEVKFFGRPIVAVATYDADKEKPVEPFTIIEQREYQMPHCKRTSNGKMALVVRKHGSGGGGGSVKAKGGSVAANGSEKKNGNGEEGEKKAEEKKNGGGEKKGNGGGEGEKKAAEGGGEEKKAEGEQLTEEQDQTLLQMKSENKTWAEIHTAMRVSKNALQARFRQLKAEGKEIPAAAKSGDDKKGGNDKKDGGNKKEGGEKKSGGENGKNEGKGDKAEEGKKGDNKEEKADKTDKTDKKPPSAKGSVKGSVKGSKAGSEAHFSKAEWMTLMEDENFSFDELQYLSELIMRDEKQRWLRIASRFADVSGKAIHPDDLKAKFAQMEGRRR